MVLFSLLFISFLRFEGQCGSGVVLTHKPLHFLHRKKLYFIYFQTVLHMPPCVAIRCHQYVTIRRALADSWSRWGWNCKGESCCFFVFFLKKTLTTTSNGGLMWFVAYLFCITFCSHQAESELQRATMDATRTTRQLEETIDEFEKQKIWDIKVWSSEFIYI